MRRRYVDGEDAFYYIPLYNENYEMPPMPATDGVDVEQDILAGLHPIAAAPEGPRHRADILASGPTVLAALEAQKLLAEKHDVAARVWSATSYVELRNQALETERHNRLHPAGPPRTAFVTAQLGDAPGPVVAVSDYMKAVPDMVGRFVPRRFIPLGTDGYGRSDTRAA